MELVRLTIPGAFVAARAHLAWRDVLFGIENELLEPGAAIDLAVAGVIEVDAPSPSLVELAGLRKGERTVELVRVLAADEPENAERTRRLWLYLVLAWLFEQKDTLTDPLGFVENVYADFDYPPQIAAFVRHMPMTGPDLGSRALNEARLIAAWGRYIVQEAEKYEPVTRAPTGSARP